MRAPVSACCNDGAGSTYSSHTLTHTDIYKQICINISMYIGRTLRFNSFDLLSIPLRYPFDTLTDTPTTSAVVKLIHTHTHSDRHRRLHVCVAVDATVCVGIYTSLCKCVCVLATYLCTYVYICKIHHMLKFYSFRTLPCRFLIKWTRDLSPNNHSYIYIYIYRNVCRLYSTHI